MSDSRTRDSIIVGVCRQDHERWSEFDAIYRPMLFAFLRKQGLSDFDADDVVQDIFIKLRTKIDTYDRTRCKFRTWLFGLALNTLIDKARRRATFNKALEGWARNVLQATPSDSVKMAEAWGKLHRTKILKHAMETVRAETSTRAWTCFEQRFLRDRPGAEIARELGITPNAVFVNAHRVLKQVTAICQEFDEDPRDALDSLTCPDETELLALAMREPLDPAIVAHVAECSRCQANRDRFQAQVALLRQDPEHATTPSSTEHGPADVETEKNDDQLLQIMERLRTQNQFDVIKAVQFAYRGE